MIVPTGTGQYLQTLWKYPLPNSSRLLGGFSSFGFRAEATISFQGHSLLLEPAHIPSHIAPQSPNQPHCVKSLSHFISDFLLYPQPKKTLLSKSSCDSVRPTQTIQLKVNFVTLVTFAKCLFSYNLKW